MKKYYGVVYLKNGDACVSRPCDTEEQCVEALKKAVARNWDAVDSTTYMVREAESIKELFGNPKTRNFKKEVNK